MEAPKQTSIKGTYQNEKLKTNFIANKKKIKNIK